MVENAAAITRDVQINPSIGIVIGGSHPHPKGVPGHAGFLGDIGEGAVMIVAVQRVPYGRAGFKEVGRTAVDKVNIHPAVIVIIKERAPCPDCLRQMMIS